MESQQILPDRYPPPRKPRDGNGPIRSFVLFAALALFVAIGGQLGSQIVRTFMGYSEGTNQIMVTALLLNVALILLTWRRTNALSDEIHVYRQAEVRAQHLAMTDPLTNLYNRRAFKEKTSEMIARASRRVDGRLPRRVFRSALYDLRHALVGVGQGFDQFIFGVAVCAARLVPAFV
jgi:hypothetical protein